MRIFPAFLSLCVTLFALQSCQWVYTTIRTPPKADTYNPDQNIILFAPSIQGQDTVSMPVAFQRSMIAKVNQTLRDAGKDTISIRTWCPCDSSLVLLEGTNLDQLNISGKEMASNTRPSGGVEGNPPTGEISFTNGNNTLKWDQVIEGGSRNYILTLPLAKPESPKLKTMPPVPQAPTTTEQPFIIAITDTGITPDLYPAVNGWTWVNPDEVNALDLDKNGLIADKNGWNFVNNTTTLTDSNGHGTLVNSLIHEQLTSNTWATQHVRYLHLKTFNINGKGTLFNNLCAMSYARQKKAKIINASWGFYNAAESKLLSYFLRELAATHIAFVAAAGNESPELESSWFGLVPTPFFRNLETNPFWPANFSHSHKNVITVTTIHPKQDAGHNGHTRDSYEAYETCKGQNYSRQYVNFGVFNFNLKNDPFCSVWDFTKQTPAFTSGSSFAAPVVTGKLVAKLGPDWPGSDRDELIKALDRLAPPAPGQPILKKHPSLESQIIAGRYILR
ncbi:hypothetical protein GCM10028803_27500 [Larkinella knui]|uniref:Peptidase S8/S53 domain-containing protein n=1 Tax=Larkinella knui TaxID=2025310 RepID=A0A3P1CWK6_9BACT|nr:S8 family serine peptidase [Larkinella knui]RRB17792.1 hypothetical protein EHT87_05805 [Larkinella knui]